MGTISPVITDTDLLTRLFNGQKLHFSAVKGDPVNTRKQKLKRMRSWILAHRADIHKALFDDFKKPSMEVDSTEIFPAVSEISHALKNLSRWTRPTVVSTPFTMLGTRSRIVYEPRGVCLILAPWNYPFNLCVGPLISAIAAGNCAMVKPSEVTSHTSSLVKRMVEELFDPREVVVCEGDAEIAKHLLTLPFDHIFFTGSPAIGKLVMRAASENLTSVTLELGGKSPALVTPSARVKEAAKRIALTKFINNGQTCIAPDYVLAHESMVRELVSEIRNQLTVLFADKGNTIRDSPHYARIVSDKHFSRILELIHDAVEKGAKLETAVEHDASTRYIHPLVVTNVSMDMRIMEEEIFGPVLPVLTYRSLEEALKLIRQQPKPLALYFFGSDKKEQEMVVNETSSGAVGINDCAIHFLQHNLPFGGVNSSGIGKSHGYHGFLAFSNEKPVLKQKSGFTSFQPFFPPYTERVKKWMGWLLRLI